jgi:hypothetical protein
MIDRCGKKLMSDEINQDNSFALGFTRQRTRIVQKLPDFNKIVNIQSRHLVTARSEDVVTPNQWQRRIV